MFCSREACTTEGTQWLHKQDTHKHKRLKDNCLSKLTLQEPGRNVGAYSCFSSFNQGIQRALHWRPCQITWLDYFARNSQITFIIFVLDCVCAHMHRCHIAGRKFKDNLCEVVLFFHRVGPVDQTQVIKLVGNILYPLSHLAGLRILNFKNLNICMNKM